MNENKRIEKLFKQNKKEFADAVFEQKIVDMLPPRFTYVRELIFLFVIFITFGIFVFVTGLYDMVVRWVSSIFTLVSMPTAKFTSFYTGNSTIVIEQLQSFCNIQSLMILLIGVFVIFSCVVTYRGLVYR